MPELAVSHLSCRRNGQQILQPSNFALSGGELVILLGPNGVGKSTLIQASLGLVNAQTGTVTLDGCDVLRMRPSSGRGLLRTCHRQNNWPGPYGCAMSSVSVDTLTLEPRVD